MLQIIEQILPAFTPDYTINLKSVTNADISYDVPVSLLGVDRQDTYDSDVEEGRTILWTLQFTMRGFLFGPIRESTVIKQATVDIRHTDQIKRFATVDVEPFIDGVPLSEISKDDNWTAKITIEEIFP